MDTQVSHGKPESISKEQREKNVANLPVDKKGRMIIRNLPFDLNETHLRKLFAPFGAIKDVRVPLNPATNQNKGFGFVEFDQKNTSAKAIKALNNSLYKGRKIFVDFSVSQDVYRKIQYNSKQSIPKEEEVVEQKEEKEEKEEEMQVEEQKEEEKEEEVVMEEEKVDKPKKEKKEKKEKAVSDWHSLDGTIFVRNISYEMKEEEFFKFYEKFGALRYAKIVKQKDTGLSNGTGFLKYKDAKLAQNLLEGAEDSSNLLYDLEVNGRTMTLQKALDRNAVNQKENEELDGEQLDSKTPNIKKISSLERLVLTDRNGKRNLKLALLGTLQIPQESLEEKDKEKRSAHYDEKLLKLKNPNKFISPTRILIKGLPKKNFDESDIKAFVAEFQKASFSAKDIKHKKFIKQIQLLKDKGEGDQTKTKGIAFVEFILADDALKFMTYLIVEQQYKSLNNRTIPIIEFAIQDIRVINKKLAIFEKKNTHQMQQNQKKKDHDAQTKKTDGDVRAQPGEDQATKIVIENIIKNDQVKEQIGKVSTLLKNMKSRGIKQRLKKRISKQFGEEIFDIQDKKDKAAKEGKKKVDKVKEALDQYENLKTVKGGEKKREHKINKKAQAKKIEKIQTKSVPQKEESQIQEDKEIQRISKQIKNLRKNKRREQDHDEFDDIAQKYESKIKKKQKWSNTN